MELKRFWQVISKRRAWAAVVFVLALLVAAGATFGLPASYQASSKLLLQGRDKTLAAMDPGMAELTRLSTLTQTSSPLDTQAEVIRSKPLVDGIIARLGLTDPATGRPLSTTQFLARGKVMAYKSTDVLELTYRDPDPAVAQKVTNAWVDAYLEQNRAAHHVEASEAVKFIGDQLAKTKRELMAAEKALRNYKRANGAVDLTEESRSAVQGLAGIETEYRQALAAQQEGQARVRALRRQVGLNSQQAMASAALGEDNTQKQLRQQLLDAETNPVFSNPALGPEHPDLKAARARVVALRGELARHTESLLGRRYGAAASSPLDPVRQDLTRSLIAAEIDAMGNQTRADALRRLLDSYGGRLAAMPDREYNLTQLSRQASVASEMYKLLTKRYEDARIHAALSLGNVRVLEQAELPLRPVSPIPALNFGVALAAGAFLAAGLTHFLEYMDDTIQGVDDADKALNVALLGVIPWFRPKDKTRLVMITDPRSQAAEAFRTLRTNVRFMTTDQGRVVGLTSVAAGEGKSTTIANLAIAFSQMGKRVLLIDADMRNPTQHQLFSLPNDAGLSGALAKNHPADAITRRVTEHLDVIPAGPVPSNPSELLERPAMAALLAQVRAQYDLVLVDTPPVLPVTDTAIMASRFDGVILLLGVNRATIKAARQAQRTLKAAKATIWGMTVARMRPENDSHYYDFFHSYYQKRAKAAPPPAKADALLKAARALDPSKERGA